MFRTFVYVVTNSLVHIVLLAVAIIVRTLHERLVGIDATKESRVTTLLLLVAFLGSTAVTWILWSVTMGLVVAVVWLIIGACALSVAMVRFLLSGQYWEGA